MILRLNQGHSVSIYRKTEWHQFQFILTQKQVSKKQKKQQFSEQSLKAINKINKSNFRLEKTKNVNQIEKRNTFKPSYNMSVNRNK